jgi:hypothetical protein
MKRTIRVLKAAMVLLLAARAASLPAATVVKGTVAGEWTAAGSPYHATGDLDVLPGKTLAIDAGVTVEFDPGVSLVIQGSLEIKGTADAYVRFVRANAGTGWGGVAIDGSSATGAIEYLELTGATVAKSSLPGFPTDFMAVFKMTNGAKVRIQYSWFHDFPNPVIDNGNKGELTILDSLIENCYEAIHSAASYADIERVHIQHLHGYSDFIDFDFDSIPHSIIRDCVMEDNQDTGGDGIDTLETNCLVENCVIKGVKTDKALSLEGASTPVIRNVLVLNSRYGLVSKDSCTPEYHNVTVTGSEIAVRCYQKNAGKGGGHGSGESLILWGNQKTFEIDTLSSFDVTYSDVQGGVTGTGNIDQDPLFVNAAADDCRLKEGSPAVGTGNNGTDMGAFPYPGLPAAFVRGDANGDSRVDISDALVVLFYKFAGGSSNCVDSMDVDDSGTVDISDAIAVLEYLFRSGSAPMAPFPIAGMDPTADSLDCQRR